MISSFSWAVALLLASSSVEAIDSEYLSKRPDGFEAYRPTKKPSYQWMTPHVMTAKPAKYWDYVKEDRIESPYHYGFAKPGEKTLREPVNAITYGSSYENSNEKDAEYGLWASSLRLDVNTFFNAVIRDDQHLWVVAFMDPSCRNCQRFAPQWNKLRAYESMTSRSIKFAYVDISKQENKDGIVMKYTPYAHNSKQISTPTIIFYGRDKSHPT